SARDPPLRADRVSDRPDQPGLLIIALLPARDVAYILDPCRPPPVHAERRRGRGRQGRGRCGLMSTESRGREARNRGYFAREPALAGHIVWYQIDPSFTWLPFLRILSLHLGQVPMSRLLR